MRVIILVPGIENNVDVFPGSLCVPLTLKALYI
jgi:hypothetical protein